MKYKKYDEYVDSGVEWIGETPKNWKNWKVSHGFGTIGSGTTPDTDDSEYYDGEIPWVTTSELRETEIFDTKKKITQKAFIELSALKKYSPDTLLIAMYGATIGRLGILKVDATVNQACCAFANPKAFDSKFVFYWFYMAKPVLLSLSSGGGQPNLNQETLKRIRIPVPSSDEQQAIANFLDKEVARIDTLIQKKQQFIERLKEKRLAVISRAVTKGIDPDAELEPSGVEWLGDIPKEWEVKKLKYVAELINLKIENNEDTPLPYIGLENIVPWKGELIENKENYIPDSLSNYYFKDCVLFGKLRPYLAKACITPSEGLCSSELLVLKPLETINKYFLKYCLLSDGFIKDVNSSTFGSKMPRASWDHIGNIKIPVLNIEQQENIVRYTDRETLQIDLILAKTDAAISKLQEYKTALISAAVTGKIKVTEDL